MKYHEIIKISQRVIEIERENLAQFALYIDETFAHAVETLLHCQGRLIVCGIGKSAIIAQKMVGTLNSTGTPSIFLHAADAIHGDAGMITPSDIVIIISKSGNSEEVVALCSLVQSYGNIIICMTANVNSRLAQLSQYVIYTPVNREADIHDLVPSSSTTVQSAVADAIAISLMELRGFNPKQFAKFHPGGHFGKKLLLKFRDICHKGILPLVAPESPVAEAFLNMTHHRLGATVVTNDVGDIKGIITDGDLRRMLIQKPNWTELTAADIMTKQPKTIDADALATEAMEMAKTYSISQIIVMENGIYVGIIHLHDLIIEGLLTPDI